MHSGSTNHSHVNFLLIEKNTKAKSQPHTNFVSSFKSLFHIFGELSARLKIMIMIPGLPRGMLTIESKGGTEAAGWRMTDRPRPHRRRWVVLAVVRRDGGAGGGTRRRWEQWSRRRALVTCGWAGGEREIGRKVVGKRKR